MSAPKGPKSRGGHYCAASGCKSNSQNCNSSFFRFPKDPERARFWAMSCGRSDLTENPQNLYRSYRVCSAHFEPRMFLNDLRNRLQPHAVPIIFREHEGSSRETPSIKTPSTSATPLASDTPLLETPIIGTPLKEVQDTFYPAPFTEQIPPKIKLEPDQQIENHPAMEGKKSARIAAMEYFRQTFCRTCLLRIPEDDAMSPFTKGLYQLFKEITPILMEQDDALPSNICSYCVRRVKQAAAFKRSIENAHMTLISTLRKVETAHDRALVIKLPSNFKDFQSFCNTLTEIVDEDEGGVQNYAVAKTNIDNLIVETGANIGSATAEIRNKSDNGPNVLRTRNGNQSKQAQTIKSEPNLEVANSAFLMDNKAADIIKIENGSDSDAVTEKNLLNVTNNLNQRCSNTKQYKANDKMESSKLTRPVGGDKWIYCDQCDKKFTSTSILQRHVLYHTLNILELENSKRGNQTQVPTAKICKTNNTPPAASPHHTLSILELEKSKKEKQTQVPTAKICKTNSTPPTASPRILTEKLQPCEFCDMEIPMFTIWRHNHLNPAAELELKKNIRFPCPKCCKSYQEPQGLGEQIKPSLVNKFKCGQCDKHFIRKQMLHHHMYRSHGTKVTTVCYICGKTILLSSVHSHIRTHVSTKSVKCTVEGCPVLLKYHRSLQDHLVRVHGIEMIHMCEFCGKTFAVKRLLLKHLQSHSDDSQYMCQICGKRFTTASALRRHSQHLHRRVRAYKCPVCAQVFTYRESVKKHCGRYHPEYPPTREKSNRL